MRARSESGIRERCTARVFGLSCRRRSAHQASAISPSKELRTCRTKYTGTDLPRTEKASSLNSGKILVMGVPPCVKASQATCVSAPTMTPREASASDLNVKLESECGIRNRHGSGSSSIEGRSQQVNEEQPHGKSHGPADQEDPFQVMGVGTRQIPRQEVGKVRRHAANHHGGQRKLQFPERQYGRGVRNRKGHEAGDRNNGRRGIL